MGQKSEAVDEIISNIARREENVGGGEHGDDESMEGRGLIRGEENGEGKDGGDGSSRSEGQGDAKTSQNDDGSVCDHVCGIRSEEDFEHLGRQVECLDLFVHGMIAIAEEEERDEEEEERAEEKGKDFLSDGCRAAWNMAKEAILRSAKECNDRGVRAECGGKVCSLSRSGKGRAWAVEAAISWHEQALSLAELLPGIGDADRIVASIALCRLYPSRSQAGQLPANIEHAVRHGRTAVSLFKPPRDPSQNGLKAAALRHLGQAYALRCKGGRDRNHALSERALMHCLALVSGRSVQDEAEVHALLAGVYSRRAYGREERNCDLAAEHYLRAFEAFGVTGSKMRQIDAAVSAGTLLLRAGKNGEAKDMFERGVRVVEALQDLGAEAGGQAGGGNAATRSLLSAAIRQPPAVMRAHSGCVAAYIGLGDIWGGLEAAENSKAMSLAMRQQLRRQNHTGEERKGAGLSMCGEESVKELLEGFGDAETCYVTFFEGSSTCLRVFVVGCRKKDGRDSLETFAYSSEEVAALGKAAEDVRKAVRCFRGHFTGGAEHGVVAVKDDDDDDDDDDDRISGRSEEGKGTEDACEAALSRVASLLRLSTRSGILASVPDGCTRLVISPPSLLAGVPLTALPVHDGALRLIDLFDRGVTFTAGIRQLSGCARRRSDLPPCAPSKLLAIGSPSGTDLRFTSHELRSVALGFDSASILDGEDAQEESIAWALSRSSTQPDCVHFACHGRGGSGSVWKSGLVLGGDELLTVSDLAEWRLPKCRLVTLSACESALPHSVSAGFSSGLPAAFIASGCPCVIGSLWKVSDACTTALMIKFYEYLHRGDAEGGKVAECLAMAQRWLRGAKMSEVMRLLPKSARDAWEKEKGKFVAQRKKRDAHVQVMPPAQNINVSSRRRERGATARRQRCAGGRIIATASQSAGGGAVTGTRKASAAGGEGHASDCGSDTSHVTTRSGGDAPSKVEEQDAGRKDGTRRRCGAFSSPFYWSSFVVIGW